MDAGVVVEFRMEGGDELITLSGGYDVAIDLGKDFHLGRKDFVDIRGTDEGHGNVIANTLDGGNGVETAQLTTVGVALHVDIHRAQM